MVVALGVETGLGAAMASGRGSEEGVSSKGRFWLADVADSLTPLNPTWRVDWDCALLAVRMHVLLIHRLYANRLSSYL